MGDLEKVMTNLSNELTTWEEVCKNYPEHKTEEKDEKDSWKFIWCDELCLYPLIDYSLIFQRKDLIANR